MAYPDKPVLDYSFTAFAQALGDGSFPGAQLDEALADLKAATDAIIDFQKIVSRSDGLPANQTVGLDALTPGSSCVVNAYTSNHDKLQSPDIGTLESIGLHMIDAVGVVHAAILRLQAILLPVRTLVLSGGH